MHTIDLHTSLKFKHNIKSNISEINHHCQRQNSFTYKMLIKLFLLSLNLWKAN